MKKLSITYKRKLDKWYDPISDEEILEVFRDECKRTQCNKVIRINDNEVLIKNNIFMVRNFKYKTAAYWNGVPRANFKIISTNNTREIIYSFTYRGMIIMWLAGFILSTIGLVIHSIVSSVDVFTVYALSMFFLIFLIILISVVVFLQRSFFKSILNQIYLSVYKKKL